MIDEAQARLEFLRQDGQSIYHGYKFAYLGVDVNSKPAFIPLRLPRLRYGIEATAECHYREVEGRGSLSSGRSLVAGQPHKVPHEDCQCGFRALVLPSHLGRCGRSWPEYGEGGKVCVLEVELYGDIIEGQIGFRAGSIEVLQVSLPPFCTRCSRRKETKFVAKRKADRKGRLAPHCESCLRNRELVFSLSELRHALGTDVGLVAHR